MNLGFNNNMSDLRKGWMTRDMKKAVLEENLEDVSDNDSSINFSSEDEFDIELSDDNSEISQNVDFVYDGDLSLSTFVDQQLIIYHRMATTSRGGITHFFGSLETLLAALSIRSSTFFLLLMSQIAVASAG